MHKITSRHRRSLIAAFALLIFHADISATNIQTYSIISTEQGMPSNTVYDMLQDRRGYMWFATGAGVCRYDGRKFTNFTIKDGLTELDVLKLFEDSQNRIWMMALNGTVCYWQNDTIYNEDNSDILKKLKLKASIRSMAEDKFGTIWIGASAGAYASLSAQGVVEIGKAALPNVQFYCSSDGDLFMLNEHLRYVNNVQGFTFVDSTQNCFSHSAVATADKLHYSVVWGCNGISICSNMDPISLIISNEQLPDALNSGMCQIDNLGNVCIPDSRGGAYMIWKNDNQYSSYQFVFPGYFVNRHYTDDEGNLWVATNGKGLLFVPANAMHVDQPASKNSMLEQSINSLTIIDDGSLIVGLANGEAYKQKNDELLQIVATGVTHGSNIVGAVEFEDGIVVGNNFTILKTNGQKPAEVLKVKLNNEAPVVIGCKSLFKNGSGELFASFYGITKFNQQLRVFEPYENDKIAPDRVICPFYDSAGNLWYDNGPLLCKLSVDGKKEEFDHLQSSFRGKITAIRELIPGTLIIATYGSGIQLLRDEQIVQTFNASSGLANDICRKIFIKDDTVLVATSAGLSVLKYEKGKLRLIRNITTQAGMPSNDVKTAVIHNNQYVIGTSKGLFAIPIDFVQVIASPPRVYLSSLKDFSNNALSTSGFELQSNDANISVEFDVITFSDPQGLEYRYKLKNEDPWTETAIPQLSFTNLQPGAYNLHFSARKSNSEWSNSLILPFNVQLPWYKEPWTIIAIAIALATLIVFALAYLFKLRSTRAIVEAKRQEDLLNERLRIAADVHDDLGADISNFLMESRIDASYPGLSEREISQHRKTESTAALLLEKVDEIIWSIDPKEDNIDGFIVYTQNYFEEFLLHSNLKGSFNHTIDKQKLAINSIVRRQIFLSIKELLHNVHKHAEASMVSFDIQWKHDMLTIEITDDGKGIAVEKSALSKKGHGLENIRTRIQNLGGTILISTKNSGTCAQMQIPQIRLSPK